MNALPQIPLEGVIETPFLAQKAGAIRALAKNVARDIAEIGRHLTEAKAACKHGEWGQWLDVEFAWSDRTAQKYMQVFKMASNTPCVADLDVPVGALIDLSAPSTPAAAIEEAIARAEAGETLTRADVDAMIAKAKAEAAEAVRIAAEKETAHRNAELFDLRGKVEQYESASQDASRIADAAAKRAAATARAEAERQIETLTKEIGKIKSKAAADLEKAAAAGEAKTDKSLDRLREMLVERDEALAAKNKRIDELLTEITKAEKQSSADVKKMRKELDEAGAVTGFIHDTYGNLASLPEPKIAVARAAKRLPHAVHPEKARMVAQWLTAFADEWEKRK